MHPFLSRVRSRCALGARAPDWASSGLFNAKTAWSFSICEENIDIQTFVNIDKRA